MRVSIIIPCYNNERFVAEAIESALSQTYPIAETIVVNDGSTDGSLEVIQSFSGIIAVSQANAGAAAARNRGLGHATGDYIVFLDADDRLRPEAVALHLACFMQNPDAPMVYGSVHIIDNVGASISDSIQEPSRFDWREVLFGRIPSPSQSMFRRESLRLIGDFDPNLRIGEDFAMYLRLATDAQIVCHGAIVADYRKHADQQTRRPAALLDSTMLSQRNFRASFDEAAQSDPIWARADRHWKEFWGQWILNEAIKSGLRRDWSRLRASLATYLRCMPYTVFGTLSYVAGRLLGR